MNSIKMTIQEGLGQGEYIADVEVDESPADARSEWHPGNPRSFSMVEVTALAIDTPLKRVMLSPANKRKWDSAMKVVGTMIARFVTEMR